VIYFHVSIEKNGCTDCMANNKYTCPLIKNKTLKHSVPEEKCSKALHPQQLLLFLEITLGFQNYVKFALSHKLAQCS